jgi:hypothetical protein
LRCPLANTTLGYRGVAPAWQLAGARP